MMSYKMEAKVEKVLRAMDVIPPYDSHGESSSERGDEEYAVPTGPDAAPERDTRDDARLVMFADEDSPPTEDVDAAIPTLDLGEKILAEQRRAIAQTRRAPGTAPLKQDDLEDEVRPGLVAAPVEVASDEVAQLQQIVADIVARDIERLCHGLKR